MAKIKAVNKSVDVMGYAVWTFNVLANPRSNGWSKSKRTRFPGWRRQGNTRILG